MAKLLVSVRSAIEAESALAGGASIIDVKEPSRGPLGRADVSVWGRVRDVIPPSVLLSVALGELNEWPDPPDHSLPRNCWTGIHFRKLGLSEASPSWSDRWRRLRDRWGGATTPDWVAVIYLDWEAARAPDPTSVIRESAEIENCKGVLFDTWDKTRRVGLDRAWGRQIDRVRESGRFVALAGSLDEDMIRHLGPLRPDVFAVRGAACHGGDRRGSIDPARVARLVEAAG